MPRGLNGETHSGACARSWPALLIREMAWRQLAASGWVGLLWALVNPGRCATPGLGLGSWWVLTHCTRLVTLA